MQMKLPAVVKWGGAVAAATWGSISVSVQFLFIAIAFDYTTGVAAAFIERKASSEVGLRGLVKKSMILLLVLAVAIAEHYAPPEMKTLLPVSLSSGVAAFYTLNEFISIVENVARCGVPIPASVIALLKNAKKLGGDSAKPDDLAQLRGE